MNLEFGEHEVERDSGKLVNNNESNMLFGRHISQESQQLHSLNSSSDKNSAVNHNSNEHNKS